MRWDSDDPPFVPTAPPRSPALVRRGIAVVALSVAACGSDDGGSGDTSNTSTGTGGAVPPMVAPGTGGQATPMVAGTGGSVAPMPDPGTGGSVIAPMVPPTGGAWSMGGAPAGGSWSVQGGEGGSYGGGDGGPTAGAGGSIIPPMPPPMPAPEFCGSVECPVNSTCCNESLSQCSEPLEPCNIAPMPAPP